MTEPRYRTRRSAAPLRNALIMSGSLAAALLSGCFSAVPSRGGEGTPGPPPPTAQSGEQGSPTARRPEPTQSTEPSSSGRQATSGAEGKPGTGRRTSSQPGEESPSGRDRDADSATGDENVRVATAERPGASRSGADADLGQPGGSDTAPEVGVEDALEAANAAVDAAGEAVENAEQTIDRAREVSEQARAQGEGRENAHTFDPWSKKDGDASESDSATEDEPVDEASADGEENFDPFAEPSGGGGGASSARVVVTRVTPSEASLQAADNALSTARSALNRAQRALIAAAGAGGGDADAEAVQLAAAQAALEAAAEAVVASALAVMAASASFDPDAAAEATPEEIQAAMERFAEGLDMVVSVLHKEMRNAGDALEATAGLLEAAGQMIAMIGNAESRPEDEDDAMSPGQRVASLDEKLDASLAVFDERMQAEGSSVVPGTGEGDTEMATLGDGAGRGTSVAASDPSLAAGNSGPISRRDGEWANPSVAQGRIEHTVKDQEDLEVFDEQGGPAQDDDIIARQLREAAVAETDPELRERLWEEYYAYKESLERGEAESTQ